MNKAKLILILLSILTNSFTSEKAIAQNHYAGYNNRQYIASLNTTKNKAKVSSVTIEQAPRELPFPLVPGAVFESGDLVTRENGGSSQYLRFKTPYDRNQLVQWCRSALQSDWKLSNVEEQGSRTSSFKACNNQYGITFTFLDHTNGTRAADVAISISTHLPQPAGQ